MLSINCLIGHRGTGKTSLLKELKMHHPHFACFDLDQEIEKQMGLSVRKLWQLKGEQAFRQLEKEVFAELLAGAKGSGARGAYETTPQPAYIALGAGFALEEIPHDLNVFWIRRESDREGRIFLDRPILDLDLDPISSFLSRFENREKRYLARADFILTLREGQCWSPEIEKVLLAEDMKVVGTRTLVPKDVEDRRLHRLVGTFSAVELRTDVLESEQIRKCLRNIPREKALLSIRTPDFELKEFLSSDLAIDWDLALGAPPDAAFKVLSHHEYSNQPRDLFRASEGHLLKWAPLIKNFDELRVGHEWHLQNPRLHIFLPRSPDGRWGWYRLLFPAPFPLFFVREDTGSALDQPTILEAKANDLIHADCRFAAVIGSPIRHSISPVFHESFFRLREMPYFRIQMTEAEFQEENLSFLKNLGLRFASITSPLKRLAFNLAKTKTQWALEAEAVNTLAWDIADGSWTGAQTDSLGLFSLLEGIDSHEVCVIGGGGTHRALEKALPQADFYSFRDLQRLRGPGNIQAKFLVWAAGGFQREWLPQYKKISLRWSPKFIFDLDYRENSAGRYLADICGAQYVGGEKMFMRQAKEQQKFWSPYAG